MTTQVDGNLPDGSADEHVEVDQTNKVVEQPTVTNRDNILLGDAPVVKPEANVVDQAVGSFGDAGDPAMNLVYRFIEKNGFKPNDAEIQSVVERGDFSLLRAKLASMGDKAQGWQEYLGIAERHFKSQEDSKLQHAASCEKAIHASVGGEEQWVEIRAWASANADADEKKAFNAMLEAGPVQAKAAARMLAEYYNRANGTVIEPKETVSDRATKGSAPSYALSPQEYAAAVIELSRKVGAGRIDNHPEYAKLQQRRAAWRG